jgi:hypothetical protein
MVWHKVSQNTNIREGIANSIHDENTDNQQCKGFICEAGAQANDTSKVNEGSDAAVNEKPNRDPGPSKLSAIEATALEKANTGPVVH